MKPNSRHGVLASGLQTVTVPDMARSAHADFQTAPYRLPDNRIVWIDITAAKDARIIDFTLKGGRVVMAIQEPYIIINGKRIIIKGR